MRSAFPIVVLGAMALTACGSVRTPDLSMPAAYEAPQPLATPAESAALDTWWTRFDDPQLTQLIEETLAANPDAKSAAARLREAHAQRDSELAQVALPTGDITTAGHQTHQRQISGTVVDIPGFSTNGASNGFSADFNVSWEIDLFGRIFAANRAATAQVDAARFDYWGTRASLAAQTADTYFQVRGLAIQLADARETARIQRDLYDVANRRAAAGLAATSEPDRIAGDLAQAEAQAALFEAELQVEKRTLLILAGRIVEPTTNISAPPEVGQAPPVPSTLPSQLLHRRPDVRQAEAQLRSALGQRDLAKLALFPTLTFTPGIGWSSQSQPGFATAATAWTIGGTIAQPILNMPRLLADVRVESARADEAVGAYEKTVQNAFGEAEASLVRLDADRRRVATLTDGEARAARAYKAMRLGYSRGLVDLDTTLSSEQSWRTIRAQLASAQVQAVRQAVQAYKAVGGGWPSHSDS
jgi:NodT family efflux transporter outer membrane factor (OMF) lipoprotein